MKTSLIKALAFGGFISGAAAFMFVGCGEAGSGALSKQAFDISVQDYEFVTPGLGNNTELCTFPQFQIRFKNQMACQVNSSIQDMVKVFDRDSSQTFPLTGSYPIKESATTCLYNFSTKEELPANRILKMGVYSNTGSSLSILPNTAEFSTALANATNCKGTSTLDVTYIDGASDAMVYRTPGMGDYGSVDEATGNIIIAPGAEGLLMSTLTSAAIQVGYQALWGFLGLGIDRHQDFAITFNDQVDLRTVKSSAFFMQWNSGAGGLFSSFRNFSVKYDNSNPSKQNRVVIVTPESDGWPVGTSLFVVSRSVRGLNGVPMFKTAWKPLTVSP